MRDQFANKIKRLELENFTCFAKAEFDFSPGINVIIGENGTGKTHLLKVLYYLINRTEKNIYSLSEIFNTPRKNLIRNNATHSNFELNFFGNQYFSYKEKIYKNIERVEDGDGNFGPIASPSLFLPPVEILSWQRGFINFYSKQENGFDKTYFDLAVALNATRQKGAYLEKAKELVKQLEEVIKADIFYENNRFYFKFHNNGATKLEASIVAQGINKIGQLIYLVLNGSLNKNTILFWDEPEVGLNPKFITIVAGFIQMLANAGVQIFVASHDYLLVHELSLLSEYKQEIEMDDIKVPDIKFFGLYKRENGSTQIEEGNSMADIQNDAILQEFAAHDQREEALFRRPHLKTES